MYSKQVCVNVNGAPAVLDEVVSVKRAEAPKPVPKKLVIVKLKPKEVIEISPDTEEVKKAKPEKKKEGASKKKAAQTLSCVLTAKSKGFLCNYSALESHHHFCSACSFCCGIWSNLLGKCAIGCMTRSFCEQQGLLYQKCFLLLIRGTHSIKDTLTLATRAVVPFHHSVVNEGRVSDLVLGYAHCGMVAAARWIAKLAKPCLLEALKQYPDYELKPLDTYYIGGPIQNDLFMKDTQSNQSLVKSPSASTSLSIAASIGIAEAVALFLGSGVMMDAMGISAGI